MLASRAAPTQIQAVEELKSFIGIERDARQVKKMLAVKLIYQGYGYEVITGILEVFLGALSKWKQAYERDGLVGFRPQHKGRQSYLRPSERKAVLQWSQTKAIWELNELESHLAETYDVVYESKQSYYDWLATADLSWKKTSQVNPKANAQAVAEKSRNPTAIGTLSEREKPDA
ncbi:winged helix-turn-helix domain-containing protein [Oscillatoria sp. CS-180]|uniref:helix-turn-helix domain-containing protein n=1 Tax=Oscillatoria sp. CS-180 TaxID=3021720 RepID=UPI00232CD531|nr:winged helix-turn-helix domain-containing protein [Oscillatoria sp. CS-180]MDB9527402.1 winged helix-turn-helix domain-containing protein [Oscillatoria sp. CS-180]